MWVDGPGQPTDRVPVDIRDLVRAMDREHYDPARVQGRPIPLRPPAAERLADLRAPVLAVAGALDVGEVVATAHHLAAELNQATAVVWPDVAHMIGMEAPDRLAGLIVDFLAPLPRWS
jgi:3-oxoadipate enol-lactonase